MPQWHSKAQACQGPCPAAKQSSCSGGLTAAGSPPGCSSLEVNQRGQCSAQRWHAWAPLDAECQAAQAAGWRLLSALAMPLGKV